MVKAIVGVNWGDEGKGKITDMLASEADIVVRFQGGSNAGHTIKNEFGKFSLHMLPSGVFYKDVTCVLGNGVALNIPNVMKELKNLTDQGVPEPKLLISDRALRSLSDFSLTEARKSLSIVSSTTQAPAHATGFMPNVDP